ncbi:Gfo/Idh/MocA family protein [Kribbella endophytica]
MTAVPLRAGLIGVDSSHAPSFTELLGVQVSGAVVTHAWRGEVSADFPPSRDRIDAGHQRLIELGVVFCDSPEEVAAVCDVVLIVASDARTHPAYFARVVAAGKPVYVDTRFALTRADAQHMLDLAAQYGTTVLAGSPKRFTPSFRTALDALRGRQIVDVNLSGPLPEQPGHPVLDWYGVHLVDLAVAALGPGCTTVDARPDHPVTLTWPEGRQATLTGDPTWSPLTEGTLTCADATASNFHIEASPAMLTGLLTALVTAARANHPTVPADQILDIVTITEAARTSRTTSSVVTL